MSILIQFYSSPWEQIFPIQALWWRGWGYFCPGKCIALNSSTLLTDAQDSQAEADHQQNTSNYQLAEAAANQADKINPSQATTSPRMTPPMSRHAPKHHCSSKFSNYSQDSATKQFAKAGVGQCQIYVCLSVVRLPLSLDAHITN